MRRLRVFGFSSGEVLSGLADAIALARRIRAGQAKEETVDTGLDEAFEIAKASYSVVYQRLDSVDDRIQTLQTYSASITLAVPVIVTSVNKDASFSSPWFFAAMAAFGSIVAIGAVGRMLGSVIAVSPSVLYAKWLNYGRDEFKRNFIYWAGRHFDKNTGLVNWKGWLANFLTVLFLLEGAALLIWAIRQV